MNEFIRQHPSLRLMLRYAFAVLAVAASWGLLIVLAGYFGPGLPPVITFFPAVMTVALFAGFGPGLLATFLSALAIVFWFLPPLAHDGVIDPIHRVGLVIFACSGVLISLIAERGRILFDSILEAIPANIAILDATGVIIRVNSAWKNFAKQNGGDPSSIDVGANYLAICDAVSGAETRQSRHFAASAFNANSRPPASPRTSANPPTSTSIESSRKALATPSNTSSPATSSLNPPPARTSTPSPSPMMA